MLVRSAARRQQRRTSRMLAASCAQLQLPWLAPAQLRWNASRANLDRASSHPPTSSPSPQSPLARRGSLSRQSRPAQLRRLATAASQYDTINNESQLGVPPPMYGTGFRNVAQDRHIPWDMPPTDLTRNSRLDSKPIILNTTTTPPAETIKVKAGISGTVKELLAHLHTSLAIGRKDRATAIIQRLSEHCGQDTPELSYAHAAYLEESFRSLVFYLNDPHQSIAVLQDMQKWFEIEVRKKDVRVSGKMLVVMIRAAIQTLDGSAQERSVRRYSDMARSLGPEVMDEVLFSEDYSDEEFTLVGKITSKFFEPKDDAKGASDTATSDMHIATQRSAAASDAKPAEVLPTAQKGQGLTGIKRTLKAVADLPSPSPNASAEEWLAHQYVKQQQLEDASVEIALERWRRADDDLKKLGINTAMQTRPINALMWQWYKELLPVLEKELAETKKILADEGRQETERHFYGPYLQMLSMPKVAVNTIIFTMTRLTVGKDHTTLRYENDVKVNTLILGLAKILEQECRADINRQQSQSAGGLPKKAAKHVKSSKRRSRPIHVSRDTESHQDWPMIVRVKLGAMLISKLIETAHLPVTRPHPRTGEKITQLQPAFLHRTKYHHGKRLGMVQPNAALVEKIQSEPVGSLIAKQMPMVVEPRQWTSWEDGGYLHYHTPILRLPIGDKSGKDYFLAADRKGDLEKVYAGLNALGGVPWQINPEVFAVQLEAWNSGEAVANFAPLHPEFQDPPEPDHLADPNLRYLWIAECRENENKRMGLHSKRCFQNFQMEAARSFLGEKIYLPHNLDFRGRAYPIPPYLNHMGADNIRALFRFAEGKELGLDGLRWLKIHLATVAGHDKASLEERVEFTESHLDDIYDSVRSPLNGRRWWLKSEDAWQTLAACFELTQALDSPDPVKFVSRIPVQQDGTCNGLQHYAALGGDSIGAAQVNLEPSDRPADVYTAVAQAVKEDIHRDALQGNEIARKLDGHITRKCVKQPVMTNVYGVTYYGARLQVRRQLEILFPDVKRSDAITVDIMARYVAEKIFKSLGKMFAGAQATQAWLGTCADRITTCLTPEQIEEIISQQGRGAAPVKARPGRKSKKQALAEERQAKGLKPDFLKTAKSLFKSTVVWTTPLGLPVVQPYRASRSRTFITGMQNLSVSEPQVWDPVAKRKQLQAFPPNFIHSLDSTHMLLSAAKCHELGITFASIHDSFWTHACDVNSMSVVLRDAFVAMHSEDVIGRLREEFQARFKNALYMTSIDIDGPLGSKIKELRATPSWTQADEIKLEYERLQLLASEDAAERAKGEAMVTPGSLFAAAQEDPSTSTMEPAPQTQTLGDMPLDLDDSGIGSTNSDADDAFMQLDGVAGETDAVRVGVDEDVQKEAEAEALSEPMDDMETEEDDLGPRTRSKTISAAKHRAVRSKKLYLWLPVTFPEVPAKGDFDVTRLRQSKYFFH